MQIVKTLQKKGFEAYFVGGCVRDMLLKRDPKDIDIVTNAKPDEIEDLFEKTYPIGKHFGVILIREGDYEFEIATFRSDSGYSDGRRPDFVTFSTAEEDAKRRDFTMNGIFYDPLKDTYLDFVDGQSDLRRGLLRFIGEPEKRIQEDFLRILRAVRFKNRFDLAYESETRKSVEKHASLIIDVSAERIRNEFEKMIQHHSREQALRDLWDLRILQKIFPETIPMSETAQPPNHHMEGDVLEHTFLVMDALGEDESMELYWAAFFHDVGKPKVFEYDGDRIHFPNHALEGSYLVRDICKRLNFSKYSSQKIEWLIAHHHLFDRFEEMKLSTRLEYFDHPFFEDLPALCHADLAGCRSENPKAKDPFFEILNRIEENYEYAKSQKILPSHYPELLTGDDICQVLDMKPGPRVGEMKEQVRRKQIEGDLDNRMAAIEYIKTLPIDA